ncbi:MAG: GNAT family N-acetyltransferase [Thalassovita sp.]
MSEYSTRPGFSEIHRSEVANLFWAAFGEKLGLVMGPADKALSFVAETLDPKFAISALSPSGALLGVAGFKTTKGALVGGSLRDLARHFGWGSLFWRAPLLSVLERDPEPGSLLMDGIFVAPAARGMGIGSALLTAIKDHATREGLNEVRLDVINTNPRAKALYERQGFVPGKQTDLGLLSMVFKYQSSTTMRFPIDPHKNEPCRNAAN